MPFLTRTSICAFKKTFQKNQALPNGANIEKQASSPLIQYQDFVVRFRYECPFRRPAGLPSQYDLPYQIEILDSVAGYHYILDTVHSVAHRGVIEVVPRKSLPPPSANTMQNPLRQMPGPGGSAYPQRSTEPLGEKVVDGLPLEGRRTTTTYPAGSSMGNDRPVTITSEDWAAPGSAMSLFGKTSDPRSGDEIAASYDIVRGEPDPSLFQVPSDYQIVDEPGPFAITFIFKRLVR